MENPKCLYCKNEMTIEENIAPNQSGQMVSWGFRAYHNCQALEGALMVISHFETEKLAIEKLNQE